MCMQRLRIISGVWVCVGGGGVRARACVWGGGEGSRFEHVNEFVQAGKKAKYSLPVTSLIIYILYNRSRMAQYNDGLGCIYCKYFTRQLLYVHSRLGFCVLFSTQPHGGELWVQKLRPSWLRM